MNRIDLKITFFYKVCEIEEKNNTENAFNKKKI